MAILLRLTGFGVAFYVVAVFWIVYGVDSSFAPIWFSNAIGVVGLLTIGTAWWPLAAAIYGFANLMAGVSAGLPLINSLVFVPCNLAEVVLSATLIRRYVDLSQCFSDVAAFHRLMVLGIVLPCSLSAILASVLLPSVGIGEPLEVIQTWFIGDMIGQIVIVPYLLFMQHHRLHQAEGDPVPEQLLTERLHPLSTLFWRKKSFFLAPLLIIPTIVLWIPDTSSPFILMATLLALVALLFSLEQSGLLILSVPALSAWQINHGEYFLYTLPEATSLSGLRVGLALSLILPLYIAFTSQISRANMLTVQRALVTEKRLRDAESHFLSNMSHELRNPLNGVIGMLRSALQENRMSDIHDAVSAALISGEQLHRLVDDILDFKKMESGHYTINPEPFDFHALHHSFHTGVAGQLEDRQLAFVSKTRVDALPRFIVGDRTRFFQIALNLVSNAIKFTPDGGHITVETGYDRDTQSVTLAVQDSGIGMTEEQLATVFERFKQGDNSFSRHFGGTGLGLAITRELVHLMNGEIEVDSKVGRGTTVRVRVPAPIATASEQHAATVPAQSHQVSEAPPEETAHLISGARILCVDDSNINLKVIARTLERAGAIVWTALSGQQALERLAVQTVDVVVTDISMPGMDGLELRASIAATHPQLPVIALTGNVLEHDVKRYLQSGFSDALGKPLDPDKLFAAIARALKRA